MAAKSTRRFAMIFGVLVVSILSANFCVNGEPQVPCYFIFGDSLADNGNNNNLLTLARANYKPYGIDFPSGPTGRFCNGRTNVDILAQLLGIEDPIPPFASISGHDVLKGLNYASGAGGILAATAFQVGDRISLDRQLRNHQETIARIAEMLGSQQSADQYLNKCLYSVGMGSNDYINNYFMPQLYLTSVLYTPEKYATLLIKEYSRQIMTLYKYGARKVALIGLGPLGCTPQAISTSDTNGSACVDKFNTAAQIFNQKLISLVDQLNINLTNARFVYMNTFGMAQGDPAAAGFKVVNVGCCPVNIFGQCIADQTPCPNRSEYMFWDGFHPTEAANLITAPRMYAAFDPSDTYPMDISHLVQLKL